DRKRAILRPSTEQELFDTVRSLRQSAAGTHSTGKPAENSGDSDDTDAVNVMSVDETEDQDSFEREDEDDGIEEAREYPIDMYASHI
ncbi:hypothetical protein OIV83_006207, partial [Microbotryomycetes sp. JL201]